MFDKPEPMAETLFVVELNRFATKYGWINTKEIVDRESEGQIDKCAACGRLTDEYNEKERRHLHFNCLGEWLGAGRYAESDDPLFL